MARWLQPSSYHSWALFLALGVFGVIFALNSYNLVTLGMANIHFLKAHGVLAIMEGGLGQLAEIAIAAFISLASYIGFKTCEVELVARWRNWRSSRTE